MKTYIIYFYDGYRYYNTDNIIIAIGRFMEDGCNIKDIIKIESNEIKD